MKNFDHHYWMTRAFALAQQAGKIDEVPVGALVVQDGILIGQGYNQPLSTNDPSAHAEIIALRDAASQMANYRLPGAILYVTIEPCTMCVGALIHARIDTVVFGAREPRAGALVSNLKLHEASIYNHRLKLVEGIMAEECGALISKFFQAKRAT